MIPINIYALSAIAAYIATAIAKGHGYITIDSSNGPITGHIAPGTDGVIEYLGIPFAKPPTGALRFAPPLRLSGKRPYTAAKYGYDCPFTLPPPIHYPNMTSQAQKILDSFAGGDNMQNEDCLTLNIWARPTERSIKMDKPTIVFFHGGEFTTGSTHTNFYNGRFFADEEDVIIVTVNYRINIFGFPGAPGQAQNLGLRDQRAAVEWLKENIEQFGGSPSKITIAGQSAGGASVDYWAFAYEKDPVVGGMIALSGNVLTFPSTTLAAAGSNWDKAASLVGCADADDTMACMRQVDWKDLKKAAASIAPAHTSSVLRDIQPFYPVPDGKVVFEDYARLTAKGRFAKVPVLLSNGNNEAGFYRVAAYGRGIIPTDEQIASFNLGFFTCPVAIQARARHSYGVPSWAYRYMADWDNTRLHPSSGGYHGSDLHMIFGESGAITGIPATDDQRRLTRLMRRAWFLFSDDPADGLSQLGWPKFATEERSLILIGDGNTPTAKFVDSEPFEAPCSTAIIGGLGTTMPTSSQ
ncbi:carboxylesterase [Cordyceps javanica]|uniref:Carboxylic ester hydrolase n=1 Tax=Cordyceps javanica TaxID=43265 RepID=A0A545VD14_9HYPO|nr:carboxylesterase [Cordyceps javanica]TQW10702.1 carboxylesterase [Cordyceps javanica]